MKPSAADSTRPHSQKPPFRPLRNDNTGRVEGPVTGCVPDEIGGFETERTRHLDLNQPVPNEVQDPSEISLLAGRGRTYHSSTSKWLSTNRISVGTGRTGPTLGPLQFSRLFRRRFPIPGVPPTPLFRLEYIEGISRRIPQRALIQPVRGFSVRLERGSRESITRPRTLRDRSTSRFH